MSLSALVYVSLASHQLSDQELKDILMTAREFNSQHEVTGMLLYRDGFFAQALEGEETTIKPLYEKIARDPRHKNVLLVYSGSIEQRSFPKWSMGFNKIDDAAIDQVPGLNDLLQGKHEMDFFTDQPSRATQLLELFKDRIYF